MDNISLGIADKIKVKKLLDLLMATLDQETACGQYSPIDIFMAGHNFHTILTLSLEQQTEDTSGIWRTTATIMMRDAMTIKPPFQSG